MLVDIEKVISELQAMPDNWEYKVRIDALILHIRMLEQQNKQLTRSQLKAP